MHAGAVVTLGVVLEDQFPICAHLVLDTFCGAKLWQIPVRELARERREILGERLRIGREIDEDEAFPERKRDFA